MDGRTEVFKISPSLFLKSVGIIKGLTFSTLTEINTSRLD